jgi:hypothetical protein
MLEIQLRLLRRAWEMRRDRAITAEIERASNLRIDIERGAVAERKGLSLLIGTIRVLGRAQTLPTFFVDGGSGRRQ